MNSDKLLTAVENLQHIKQKQKELDRVRKECEITIQLALGDADRMQVGHYRISYPVVEREAKITVPFELKSSLEQWEIDHKVTKASTYRRMIVSEV